MKELKLIRDDNVSFYNLKKLGINLYDFICSHPILSKLEKKYGWRAWSEPGVTYGTNSSGGSFDTNRVGQSFIRKKIGKITFYFG